MKKNIFIIGLFSILAFAGCKNQSGQQEDPEESAADTASASINEQAEFQFDLTVSNIPAPYTLLDDIAKTGIGFNKDLVNPLSNAERYTSASKKAINFGIYSIDLGYLAVYNQNQEVINYFVQTRKMSKDLGAGPFFDDIAGSIKLDKTLGDKEQMLTLLDKAYTASDKYLRSNQRLVSASLMLVGGWAESQYIALELLKNEPRSSRNEAIYTKIWEQRAHLANIIKLLEELRSEEGVNDVLEGLKDVEPAYKELSQNSDLTQEKAKVMARKLSEFRAGLIK
jgi:hypothetical protein